MKLIKCTLINDDFEEAHYINEVEMISDDPNELKSKAHELCRNMEIEVSPWGSRHPIMGKEEIKSNPEWIMQLSNGIAFIIEK